MNLTEEINQTWVEKDRDKMSVVVQKQYDFVNEKLLTIKSNEIPELYKFNGGFPNMIKVFDEALKEGDFHKAKYILELFIDNYSLTVKKKANEESVVESV